MTRPTVTIYIPDGYKDANEFLTDCQFEPVQRSSADNASEDAMTALKHNQVLSFYDGLLTVKMSGHGSANGWATMSFKEEQFELDADGYQVVEIAPSELRELRDFLNRVIPNEPQAPAMPKALDCMEYMPLKVRPLAHDMDEGEHWVIDADNAYVFKLCCSHERAERIVAALNAAYSVTRPQREKDDQLKL